MAEHVSERNARTAADNLQAKINFVMETLHSANGRDNLTENVLAAVRLCPSSRNQFNAMLSENLPIEIRCKYNFSKNAAKTLRDDTVSTSAVDALIRLRSDILLHGKVPSKKLERLVDLKRKTKFDGILLEITQAENDNLRAKLEALEVQMKEDRLNWQSELREFKAENSRLRVLIAEQSAKSAQNVRPLKRKGG